MKKLALLASLAAAQSIPAHNLLRFPTIAANNETVTIGSITYTFKTTPDAEVATEVAHGGDAATSRANLLAAINANQDDATVAVAVTNGLLVVNEDGTALATTETLAGANNGWAAATMIAGRVVDALKSSTIVARAATATEEALELMVFPLNFTPTAYLVQVRTAAGVLKAWDGAVTVSGNRLHLASSGTTDIAATDVVTVYTSA